MSTWKRRMILTAAALVAAAGLSCSNELTNNGAPVEFVVTNSQNLSKLDLLGGTRCNENIGTINMQVFPKNTSVTGSFTQVRVTRYRVSYQRFDGGTLVPAPFVRSIDSLVGAGTTTGLSDFTVLQGDAVLQAPFAALFPNNGGRDPETGRTQVSMDVVVELFGETLGGDNVYDSTRFPLTFCYNCQGCD